jgi:hypothetical protein
MTACAGFLVASATPPRYEFTLAKFIAVSVVLVPVVTIAHDLTALALIPRPGPY